MPRRGKIFWLRIRLTIKIVEWQLTPSGRSLFTIMEFSKERMKSFMALQDTEAITDESFDCILGAAVSHLCKQLDTNSIENAAKSVNEKTAFVDICCIFVEAARHDFNKMAFASFLSDARITGDRAKKLCDAYEKNKNGIQGQLELIGYNPMHIVDIDWRLDYCVKVDTCNSVGVPLYHVHLTTKQNYDAEMRTGAETKGITFTCTTEQFQDLVSKIKDAARHLDKLTKF